jgi:hypothetical protein
MFSFFGKQKRPNDVTSRIVFDEGYCHSAGQNSGGQTYEINEGTTEIVFVFEKFDEFIGTYLFNNPYLPEEIKQSVRDRKAIFCVQVVQGGPYLCTDSVSADGHITLRSKSLTPLNGKKPLNEFSSGAIGFGVLRQDTRAFAVLWATMYKTA